MNERTFAAAFARVTELTENFKAGEQRYLESTYSESQARIDFIDKFWIALGWDVNHERERNPYEQEVKVERNVAVSNRLKKADYAFFAAPNFRDVKFYVEAKKPARNLDNADDYFQTIRYGWSSNTPLAVLTDFEQFRVIDCRYKPNIATAQNFALEGVKFHYTEYADEEKFSKIYHLFSRESVLRGSLEDYAKNLPKRGKGAKQGKLFATAIQKSVDESFLDDLDNYRSELARAFKNKNADLDGEDLTEAVTRTLDRLVFIRFLEDKLIEPDTMIDKFDSWADFVRTSSRLNGVYNGIVFKPHFIDSQDFKPDEKVFADICGELSPAGSPYNFNYIPVHILGSIYERFLGKIIVATDKRAHVEEKPEVRKAGGVYYTPEYIVRYIVENTVGKLLKGGNPRVSKGAEIPKGGNPRVSKGAETANDENTPTAKTPEAIAEMRFADIACGSGSFLLGVYDYLLRYETDFYNSYGKKEIARNAGCIENKDGSFTLSIAQRREILRNNIYGVDVDAQAVEVAQLSLALKLLEDATTATARAFQPKLGEKILPDMTRNIVCGNSLIDHDILDGQLFERNEERKLNPMSYEDKFPEIMRHGGFDAIVGNPPYGAELDSFATKYLRENYLVSTSSVDTYALFIEKSLKIMKPLGKLSLIVPTGWYSGVKYGQFRKFFANNTDPEVFINLPYDVFSAWVDTTIFVANKRTEPTNWRRKDSLTISIRTFPKRQKILDISEFYIDLESVDFSDWFTDESDIYLTYTNSSTIKLMRKIQSQSKPLQNFADVQRGVTPFNLLNEPTVQNSRLAFDGTLRRYSIELNRKCFIRFDNTLAEFKPEKYFIGERILLRELISRQFQLQAIKVKDDFVTNKSFQSILKLPNSVELNFLLGMINSKAMSWYFLRQSNVAQRDDFPKIVLKETRNLPIPEINLNNKTEKAMHDKMVALVDAMLETKKQLQTARTDKDKDYLQGRCAAIDRQIDNLVYQLYELTADEVKIIESN